MRYAVDIIDKYVVKYNPMRVRLARSEDYGGIFRLYDQFDDDRVESGVGAAGFKYLEGESPWASTLRDPDCETYVAKEGDVLLAFISVRHSQVNPFKHVKRLAEVDLIVVDRRLRRRGVGNWLFNYVASSLKRRGFSHLILNVSTRNAPALLFWSRLGFKPLSKTEYMHADGMREATSYMIKKI